MKRAIPILLLGAALLATAGCEEDELVGLARGQVFAVTMTGANVRPDPVSPSGVGNATLTLDDAERIIIYSISVANMTSPITAAHIHLGEANDVGGIIVQLTTPVNGGTVTGTITRVTPLGLGVSFEELVELLRDGDTYMDVHTTGNSDGEIRGQIDPVR